MISKKPRMMTSSTDDRFFHLKSSSIQSVLALVIFLGLSACASTPEYQNVEVPPHVMQAYLHDKPEELHSFYQQVLLQGDRNLVLNHMEAGLAAMELGALETAEESFDIALLNIETVFTDNESAGKARSLWYEEGRKFFKGEPYERAMAYYYRGLLYLMRGDYENARASFKGGILQDAIAEEERYRADFALLIFLEGWASHLLGDKDLAKSAFDEVKTFRPDFIPPKPEDNVLLIAETGWAPANENRCRSRRVRINFQKSIWIPGQLRTVSFGNGFHARILDGGYILAGKHSRRTGSG
jgi:tetratricopeptide (TPR) repeat protein